MHRRRFLAMFAALPASAAAAQVTSLTGLGQEADAQRLPSLFVTHVPGIVRRGTPTGLALSNDFAYQGGTVLATAYGGASGTATIFGRQSPLVMTEDGTLRGYVPIATDDVPGPRLVDITIALTDGSLRTASVLLEVRATQWTVDHIILPPPDPNAPPLDEAELARRAREAERERDLLATTYAGNTQRAWTGSWIVPVDGPVTGYFGEMRSFNGGPVQGHHGGTDFGVNWGTPIVATNHGTVVVAEEVITRGNLVIIDHGTGIYSGYAHQSERAVAVGDIVQQGQVIGYVGSTGLSTGPHLHWELSVGGVLVDGLRWLDGTQGF